MSDLLPYEEQLAGKLANIPLRDEDKGWDAMRKMLDDDDDDGVVPPPVNTGCRRWGLGLLLLILLGGITWGVYKMYIRGTGGATRDSSLPVEKQLGTQKDSVIANGGIHHRNDTVALEGNEKDTFKATQLSRNAKTLHADSTKLAALKTSHNNSNTTSAIDNKTIVSKATAHFTSKNGDISTVGANGKHTPNNKGVFALKSKNGSVGAGSNTLEKGKKILNKIGIDDTLKGAVVSSARAKYNGTPTGATNKGSSITPLNDSSNTIKTKNDAISQVRQKPTPEKSDTSTLRKNLEFKTEDIVARDNKFYLSAGLGLQQLIPIDGQKSSPYNAFGRKGSLADYIPSAYFRAHLNHAFLQIEFKYGAPQYTKNIAYSTKVISHDSTTGITTSLVNRVNKTYYHQLPLSIHYEVLPNLSIGAGAMWNKFQSAVVTQQNQASNGLTGTDSITSSKVINVKNDSASAFAKTYWQFMLEAQYTWKRFSLGTRYSWGLTPYLTATSSTGQTQKERNASLNVFIRYELWRSKKK